MQTLWRPGRRAGHLALPALKPTMQQTLKISEAIEAAGKPGRTLPLGKRCGEEQPEAMVSCRGQRERRTLTLLLSTPSAHAPSLPECSRAMSPTQAERTRKLGFCLPGTCRSICLEGPEQMLPRSEGTAAASPLTAHPPPACSSCCRSRAQDACALPSHRHQPGTARQGFNSIPSSSLGILLTQREGSLSCSNALVILPVPIPPSLAAAHPPRPSSRTSGCSHPALF